MRPFKFFFAVSLGIIVFLFLAKFLIMAMIIAGALSLLFYAFRKLRQFLFRLDWDHEEYENEYEFPAGQKFPRWKRNGEELFDYRYNRKQYFENFRTIEIQ